MATRTEITVNGKTYTVEVGDLSASPVEVIVNGETKRVTWQEAEPEAPVAPQPEVAPQPLAVPGEDVHVPSEPATGPAPEQVTAQGTPIKSPMPGKILSLRVQVGDQISDGDTVCTLEAMKMEMPISSTLSGTVTAVPVQVGQNVAYDDPLIIIAE